VTAKNVPIKMHVVDCDTCRARHIPGKVADSKTKGLARISAKKAGWETRPAQGPGAHDDPDHCPNHKKGKANA
jgi:hypothetical protein